MPNAIETSQSCASPAGRSAAGRGDEPSVRAAAEVRFGVVFGHLPAVVAYARRRGCADPQAIAAETMAIAWRRLADVPPDDARPWLFATARNLALAEWRSRPQTRLFGPQDEGAVTDPVAELDPALAQAMSSLSVHDREALLLVAWEDLTPAQAARSLGISAAAFRVRLHRARRRCERALAAASRPVNELEKP
jgi:RNA polymerase sigma-70 factor (ECF subfamily)